MAKNLFNNTNYAFDGGIVRAKHFFLFFLLKKIKGWPAQKMVQDFILFILLVAQLVRTGTDPIL